MSFENLFIFKLVFRFFRLTMTFLEDLIQTQSYPRICFCSFIPLVRFTHVTLFPNKGYF